MDDYYDNSDIYGLNYGQDSSLGLDGSFDQVSPWQMEGSGGLGLTYDDIGGGMEPQDYYGLYGAPGGGSSGGGGSGIWGGISDGVKSLGGWGDLIGSGLGALGMYGNYRAGQDQMDFNRDQLGLSRDQLGLNAEQLALSRELGLGRLDLDRQMGLGALDLQRDQFALGQGVDEMASKGIGMQLLVNRGKLAPEQVNPWLNMMYTGRSQMFGEDPKMGNAFNGPNPFDGFGVGAAITHPGEGRLKESINSGRPDFVQQFGKGDAAELSGLNSFNQMHAKAPALQAPSMGPVPMHTMPTMDKSQYGSTSSALSKLFGSFSGMQKKAAGGVYNQGPRGGLGSIQGLLHGATGGQEDAINARLADGEYVFDAETVSALGDGNTMAGAKKLDQMREEIRRHKRSAPASKIPPKARSLKGYMKGGM